jgi:hypothetical protein
MAAFDDALVQLFATDLGSEALPETTEAYSALLALHGGVEFAQVRELLSRWRTNFRQQLDKSARDQVIYCLNAVRRAFSPAHRALVRELARRSLGADWSAGQLAHFDALGEVFVDGHDFFLSFTGRNPSQGHAILRVNRDYEAFIARVLTHDYRAKADAARDNLLAEALNWLLRSDHRLAGFYYPDRKGDSAEVRKKLEEGCRRSLAFVQLLDNEMLLPQDDGVENYCHWEYRLAVERELEILFLFPYAKREELLPPEDRAEEVADWYARVAAADLRLLPLARDSDPARLQGIMDQVEALARQILVVRRERLARVPA